jgi:uncharacterized secreted protein with C-terminal beta-propeller domain
MGNIHNKEKEAKFVMVAFSAIMLALILFAAIIVLMPKTDQTQQDNKLAYFKDYNELVNYFQKAQVSGYGSYYGRGLPIEDLAVPMLAAGAADKSTESTTQSATDYSKTNIQVEGVDEADIVKSDGKYIYAIAQGQLFIVDAYPASEMKIVSKVDLNGLYPNEIFISGNKLLVFSNDGYYGGIYYSGNGQRVARASFKSISMPYYSRSSTFVELFDITDKAAPVLEKDISFEGSYLTSRLIGDNAYFVINSYPNYYAYEGNEKDGNSIIPMYSVDGIKDFVAQPSEIGIMPRVMPNSFVTLASINMQTKELEKTTVAGSAQNVFASQENIYFAENYWEYSDYNGPIPLEIGMIAQSVYFPNWNSMQKMAINKFSLDNGKISFVGQGIVPGYILNQFSMDEYNGNFRIATTVGGGWNSVGEGSESKNNVYVLDKDMNLIGSLEGLAPGEIIYSVRFMGEKGYVVTFKTVDPLFVLDLSNPQNPNVLGKLKIPGYSDYMQPIDETHILGIGKDVNELEDAEKVHSAGAVYYTAIKGVKMAIFDVSDVSNPKEMYKVVIGDRGTDSEALNDHKALLFDKEKELLVLPITLVENKTGATDYYGQEQTFQGAYVYNVSLENGFTERGRITHVSSEEELKRGYYYGSDSVIRRSLFMDNYLYTLSSKMLKTNDLESLSDIKEVSFPVNENSQNYRYPVMIE